MALSSEITAKLGLKTEGFSNGLNLARNQVERFGSEISKVAKQKFSIGDVFKGVLQGIGIASVQSIADKLVQPFKDAADEAERMAAASDKTTSYVEQLIALRQTEQQQLAALHKDMVALNNEIGKQPAQIGFWKDALATVAEKMGMYGLALELSNNESANAAKLAAEIEAATKKSVEYEQKKISIAKAEAAERKRADEEGLRALNEQYKSDAQRAAAVKTLTDFERTERRAKLTDEQLLGELAQDQSRLAKEIGAYENFRRQQGELSAAGAQDLLALKQQQKSVEEQIADVTARKLAAEQSIGEVVDSNTAKWRGLVMEIKSIGRGDTELSDAELKKKEQNLRKDIFQRSATERTRGALVGANYIDPLRVGQQLQLQQVQAELRLRNQVRQRADAFGEAAAFNQFGGSEQRFRDILNGKPAEDTLLLRDIANSLKNRGITIRNPSPPTG